MDIKFYNKNGTEKSGVKFTNVKESAQDMGDRNITLDVQSPQPINFQIGDYVEWRGEHFSLVNEVSVKKIASKKSYGGAFVYENITLKSVTDELVECPFSDRITDETSSTEHFTTMPSFSFVAHHLEDLALRLQACLDHMYGDDVWTITVDDAYVDDPEYDDMVISVNNQSVWEGITMCQSMYNSPFIVRGRTVTLGTRGHIANNYLNGDVIEYGKGKGAYEIERTATSDQKVITRLTAWGNTTNMHPRYYSMVGAKVKGYLLAIYVESATKLSFYFQYSQSIMKSSCQFSLLGKTYQSTVETDINGVRYPITVSTTEANSICSYFGVSYSVGTKSDVNSTNYVVFDSGVDKYNVKYANIIFPTDGMPTAMNVSNLALPGFPLQSLQDWVDENVNTYTWLKQAVDDGYTFSDDPLNPYIKSKNYSSLGDHPWTEMFTTSDATHKDIYPSLDNNEDPDFNKITKTSTEVDGTAITNDGVYSGVSDIPNFKIYLPKNLGFELEDIDISGSSITVGIKNGACGGREFTCVQYKKTTNYWELECQRIKDETLALYFPYVNGNIEQGAKFVLGNVWMNEAYVNMASVKLLKWALIFLRKNDYTTFSYNVSIDEVAIKRSENKTGANSFFMSVREGDYLYIKDDDLNFVGNIPISSLNITWNGVLPIYEITLQDTKTTGTIQKIQQQIDALTGGSGGVSSGTIADIAYQTLKDKFISREHDDNTPHNLEVSKSLVTRGSSSVGGDASVGGKMSVVGDTTTTTIHNSDKITTKDLEVTGSAHFFELVIDKAKAVGGQMILSPANAVLDEVVASTNNTYYLRFKNTDGNKSIAAGFEVGDLIICQTFNTVSGNNVSNKFYWAEVLSVTKLGISAEEVDTPTVMSLDEAIEESPSSPSDADEDVSEAEEYSSDMWQIKIQLDNTHSATNCNGVPSAGDNIVVLGNKNGGSRSNAIVISAVDSTYLMPFYTKDTGEIVEILSPSIISYKNIRAYGLDDKQDTIISPTLNVFTGELRVDTSGGSVAVKTETARDYRFRGTTTFSAPEEPTNLTWSTWGTTQHVEPSTTNKYIWKGVRISYSNGTYDYSVEYDGMLSDASSSSGEPGKDAIDLVVTKDFTSTLAAEEPSSAYDYTNGYFKLTPTTSCTVKLMQDGSPITSGVTYTFQCKGCYFTYGQSLAQSQQGSNVTITYVDKTAKTYTISGTSKTIYVPVTTPTVTFSAVYKGETYQKTIIVPVDYSKRWSTFVVDKEQISLKVNDLSTGLKQTGIDITTGEIELTADKVSFKTDDPNNQLQTIIEGGQIRSGSLVSDNGDGKVVTVANGMATFSVGNGCVEIGVDSDGNPMLYGMTINSDGTKQVLWSVGAEGTSSTSELKGKFENVKQATYTLSGQYSQYINISLELADIRMIAGTLAKNFAAGAVKVKIIGLGGITQTYSSVASVSVPSQGYVVREPLGFFGSDTFTQSLTEDGTGAPKWRGKTHVITAELRVQDELLATYNYSLKID